MELELACQCQARVCVGVGVLQFVGFSGILGQSQKEPPSDSFECPSWRIENAAKALPLS